MPPTAHATYPGQPTPPEPDGERLIAMYRKSGRPDQPDGELRLSRRSFDGRKYLDLRLWTRGAGGWWPMRGKGVSIRLSEARALGLALLRVAEEHDAGGAR